jgi:acetyl esterase/lipase
MRAWAGFCFGAVAAVAALFIIQLVQVAPVLDQVGYHFSTCVFGGPDFPTGDLDNGRLLRRALVPVCVSIRFFDAQFHEVRQAAQPGRYGAVVRIQLGGLVSGYRYVTLFRTPAKISGDLIDIPIAAPLPAEFGLNPAVVREQQAPIGEALQNMLVDYEYDAEPESFAILLARLSETRPGDPPAFLHADKDTRNEAWWYELRTRLNLAPTYRRIVDLPDGYAADPARRWPLILFLHHSDAGGSDLDEVRNCSLMRLIAGGRKVPAIVVAPQCPTAQTWSLPVLDHLLDTVQHDYRIDPDRIYLTGTSSGGDASWNLALVHPDRFAALVPMSAESEPREAWRLRHVPVWGFQGGKDPLVPPIKMREMVDAARRAGGHAHLTLFPDAGHDCWDAAYATDALWTWLFAQKRGQPEVVTPGTPSP